VWHPATKKVAAPADPATSLVRSARSVCYPSKSWQMRRRRETKESESVFSQKSSISQCGY
jgi:hypothetical protein